MPKTKTETEKRLNVRLPLSEHAALLAKAEARNQTVSEMIRSAIVAGVKTRPPAKPRKVRVPVKPTDPALLAALARIGNNLNQLARVANAKGDLPTLTQLVAIEAELKGIRDAC